MSSAVGPAGWKIFVAIHKQCECLQTGSLGGGEPLGMSSGKPTEVGWGREIPKSHVTVRCQSFVRKTKPCTLKMKTVLQCPEGTENEKLWLPLGRLSISEEDSALKRSWIFLV